MLYELGRFFLLSIHQKITKTLQGALFLSTGAENHRSTGRASDPAGRVSEPAGRALDLVGRASEQARRASEEAAALRGPQIKLGKPWS